MTTEVLASDFDYTELDAETRIVVQQRTGEIKTIARRAAGDIIEIGLKLAEVKARLGHGHFGAWLKAEFGWSEESALRFVHVAERFQNRQIDGFAPSALYMLAAPSTSDDARQEALQRAAGGERVTVKAAARIIAAPLPAGQPFATPEELLPVVRAWAGHLAQAVTTQRAMLKQIVLKNPVGAQHFERLDAFCRDQGRKYLRSDLLTAVERTLAALPADAPRGGTFGFPPAPVVTPVTADVRAVTAVGPGQPSSYDPEPDPDAAAALPGVVTTWLAQLAEENEIPADSQGQPERDAVLSLLRGLLNGRGNGFARYWQALRKHPGWPAGTTDDARLAAVRAALGQAGPRSGGAEEQAGRGAGESAGARESGRAEAEQSSMEVGQVGRQVVTGWRAPVGGLDQLLLALQRHVVSLTTYARRHEGDDPELARLVREARALLELARVSQP